jgi:putative FmdB family regulatory protein
MPIYEYKCEDCGHRMEAMQKMSEDALRDCPECQAPKLKKLISAVAFRLKGSGWYETDFKAGDKKNLASSDDKKDSSSTKTVKKEAGSSEKPTTKAKETDKSSNGSTKKASKKPNPSK